MGSALFDIGATIAIGVVCVAAILIGLVIVSQVARFGFWLYDKRR